METKNIDIIHKFLNGEIALEDVKKQLTEEEFNSWKSTLDRITDLPKPSFDTKEEYELLLKKRTVRKQSLSWWRYAAAAVLIGFCSWGVSFYLNSQTEIVTCKYQSETKNNKIYLPDSSSVVLNKGASISYDVANWDDTRKVQLNGEAFFKVKKGKRFVVDSDLGSVQVLGTEFNVSSQNKTFIVTCYEGRVAVTHDGKQLILNAKNSFSSATNQLTKINVDLPSYMRKWSVFEKTALTEVVKSIEEIKGVKINVSVSKSYSFTGGFSNDMTTDDILDLVCRTLNLNYNSTAKEQYEIRESVR